MIRAQTFFNQKSLFIYTWPGIYVYSIDFTSFFYAFRAIELNRLFSLLCTWMCAHLFHIYHASNYQMWPYYKKNPINWFNKSNFTKKKRSTTLYRDRRVKRLLAAYRILWDHPWSALCRCRQRVREVFSAQFHFAWIANIVLLNCLVEQQQQQQTTNRRLVYQCMRLIQVQNRYVAKMELHI